jgi:hypothetical protein
MTRRRRIAALVLVIGFAAAIWLIWSPRLSSGFATGTLTDMPEPEPEPESAEPPAPIAIEPVPQEADPARQPIAGDGPGTLIVTVLKDGRTSPSAIIRVDSFRADGPGAGKPFSRSSQIDLVGNSTANSDGEAVINVPCGKELRVLVTGANGDGPAGSGKAMRIPALAPAEQRRVVVELPSDDHSYLLVLGREDREPIAGAIACVLRPSGPRKQGEPPQRVEYGLLPPTQATSDAQGFIDLCVPRRSSLNVVVSGEAHAPAFVIAKPNETPARAQVVFLDRSGSIEGTVVDQDGIPVAGTFGEFSAEPTTLFQPIETSTVFGRNFPELFWAFRTDGVGGFSVAGLAPGIPLNAWIPRARLGARSSLGKVTIERGETRTVTLTLRKN